MKFYETPYGYKYEPIFQEKYLSLIFDYSKELNLKKLEYVLIDVAKNGYYNFYMDYSIYEKYYDAVEMAVSTIKHINLCFVYPNDYEMEWENVPYNFRRPQKVNVLKNGLKSWLIEHSDMIITNYNISNINTNKIIVKI